MFPRGSLVDRLVALAVDEDLYAGDVTARCCIPNGHRSKARIIARESLVFCGGPILNRISEIAGFDLRWDTHGEDGHQYGEGFVVASAEGSTQDLLSIERVCINFLQHLSGIATLTRKIVEVASTVVVLDTRKTTPGWRLLEKYATRIGGAKNHRANLGDLILIKNNHIDAHGGDIETLFTQIELTRPWHMSVECEVRTPDELKKVLPYNPDFLLLDNMTNESITECLRLLKDMGYQGGVEVSGGVVPERLKELAEIGVKAVSMGSLTTQSRSVDISMRLESVN
jgi:nicotinate-nucleotide pyrophosphorylase (carboxylating)